MLCASGQSATAPTIVRSSFCTLSVACIGRKERGERFFLDGEASNGRTNSAATATNNMHNFKVMVEAIVPTQKYKFFPSCKEANIPVIQPTRLTIEAD